MKTKLLFSTTVIFIAGFSLQTQAQTYTKGSDARVLGDTRQIQSDQRRPVQTTMDEPRRERVEQIEPAAGQSPYEDFTGVYAGGEAGYTMGSYDTDGGDVGFDGWNGGVFIGYGFEHNFDWLGAYAGIEAGYEWSGADGNLGATSYEKKDAWHVTFRPGASLYQDVLGYGIIGYSRGEFEGAEDDVNLDGLILGAGAQMNTDTALKPRLEYTYTNYEDSDLAGSDFDGHENAIKLGLVFQY